MNRPLCKLCNTRCYMPIPRGIPKNWIDIEDIYRAGIATTCRRGQTKEMEQIGWCYDKLVWTTQVLQNMDPKELVDQWWREHEHIDCHVMCHKCYTTYKLDDPKLMVTANGLAFCPCGYSGKIFHSPNPTRCPHDEGKSDTTILKEDLAK